MDNGLDKIKETAFVAYDKEQTDLEKVRQYSKLKKQKAKILETKGKYIYKKRWFFMVYWDNFKRNIGLLWNRMVKRIFGVR